METQPTHLPTFARDPITPSSAVPHWQERCKEERIVTFDVVTDKTVVYRKRTVHVMPHLALEPGQQRIAGVPIPTLTPTTQVDTRLLLSEMQNILHLAQQRELLLTGKRKLEDAAKSDVATAATGRKMIEMPSSKKAKSHHFPSLEQSQEPLELLTH